MRALLSIFLVLLVTQVTTEKEVGRVTSEQLEEMPVDSVLAAVRLCCGERPLSSIESAEVARRVALAHINDLGISEDQLGRAFACYFLQKDRIRDFGSAKRGADPRDYSARAYEFPVRMPGGRCSSVIVKRVRRGWAADDSESELRATWAESSDAIACWLVQMESTVPGIEKYEIVPLMLADKPYEYLLIDESGAVFVTHGLTKIVPAGPTIERLQEMIANRD